MTHGSRSTTGQALVEHPGADNIAFTGIGDVGETIQRAAGTRRAQVELGNISATIIWAEANLPKAAAKCTATAFRKAGQV